MQNIRFVHRMIYIGCVHIWMSISFQIWATFINPAFRNCSLQDNTLKRQYPWSNNHVISTIKLIKKLSSPLSFTFGAPASLVSTAKCSSSLHYIHNRLTLVPEQSAPAGSYQTADPRDNTILLKLVWPRDTCLLDILQTICMQYLKFCEPNFLL